MAQTVTVPELKEKARQIRISIVKMLNAAGSGHAGGAMGIADVLTALYFSEMNVSPNLVKAEERDRFILSAAHMVPGLYATLAERGFFPKEELLTLRSFGSRLQGHTFRNLDIGVETTGGSLGQGLSIAVGCAIAARMRAREARSEFPTFRTYCVIGDGETDEGAIWEAALCAAKEKLDNLCVILDRNRIQLSNFTEVVMPLDPVVAKWQAFGWHVLEIDGNSMEQILFTFTKARLVSDKPVMIVANTIPGKGVSYMENKWEWHGRAPNDQELTQALAELTASA